ncbi:hypothetical protein D3C86_1737750 [compost metagenome]
MQPGQDRFCHGLFVKDVAGADQVDGRGRSVQQVGVGEGDLDLVGSGVGGDGGGAEGVDVGGQDGGGARLHRRNGDQAGAGGQINDALARDLIRVVQQPAGQGLTTGPGEGPEGRRQAHGP